MGKMGKMEDMGERRMMSITRPLTHLTPPHIVSYGISSTTLREIMRQNNEVEVNPAGNLIISFSEPAPPTHREIIPPPPPPPLLPSPAAASRRQPPPAVASHRQPPPAAASRRQPPLPHPHVSPRPAPPPPPHRCRASIGIAWKLTRDLTAGFEISL